MYSPLRIAFLFSVISALLLFTSVANSAVTRSSFLAIRLPDDPLRAANIEQLGDVLVVIGNGDVYRVKGIEATRDTVAQTIHAIRRINPTTLIALGDRGAYRIRSATTDEIAVPGGHVRMETAIVLGDDEVWLQTHLDSQFCLLRDTACTAFKTAGTAYGLIKALDRTWIIASSGVYRVDGNVATQVVDDTIFIPSTQDLLAATQLTSKVGHDDNLIWIQGEKKFWVISRGKVESFPRATLRSVKPGIRLVVENDDETLFAIKQTGPDKLDGHAFPKILFIQPIPDQRRIATVTLQFDVPQVAGTQTVSLDLTQPAPIPQMNLTLRDFLEVGGEVRMIRNNFISYLKLIGSDNHGTILSLGDKLYRWDATGWLELGLAKNLSANFVMQLNDHETWILDRQDRPFRRFFSKDSIAAGETAYRILEDKLAALPDVGTIDAVSKEADAVWLLTDRGAYRVKGDAIARIPDQQIEAQDVVRFDGRTFIIAKDALWRVEGDYAISVGTLPKGPEYGSLWQASVHLNLLWLVSDAGIAAYSPGDPATKETLFAIPIGGVRALSDINGTLWALTDTGAFRIFPGSGIKAIGKPNKDVLAGLPGNLLPGNVGLTGVARLSAEYTGALPPDFHEYATRNGGDFVAIIDSNLAQYNQFLAKGWYTGLSSVEKDIGTIGEQTMYVSVRDKWGNQNAEQIRLWIAPGAVMSALATYILVIAIGFAVIMTAPSLALSYRVLMVPALRQIGSLYSIPIILGIFPSLVDKLLERHKRRVHDKTAKDASVFLLPDDSLARASIAQLLKQESTLFIEGPSGIGKSAYMRYLAHTFSASGPSPLHLMTTVLVNLKAYIGVPPVEAYQSELLNVAAFRDSELATEILRIGGILFLLDGLNEVPSSTVTSWASFVSGHSERHFFIVSSQYVDTAFQRLPVITMPTLRREQVTALLARESGLDEMAVAESMSEDGLSLARIPQNLMVIARLLRDHSEIPKTQFTLYEKLLVPIFAEWRNRGKTDYISVLCWCAVAESERPDGSTVKNLPSEVTTRLLVDKLMVERGDGREFAHDHVRAFLVAHLLVAEWPAVLGKAELGFGSNWTLPLQFASEKLPKTQIVKLIDAFVAKKTDAAAARAEEIAALAVQRFGIDELGTWYGEFAKALVIARQFKNLERTSPSWTDNHSRASRP
jgi:hypothetical protein